MKKDLEIVTVYLIIRRIVNQHVPMATILQFLDKKVRLTSMDLKRHQRIRRYKLIDEIINDSSIEKPQEMQISSKKSTNVMPVTHETTVPTPPPDVVAAVFQEETFEQDQSPQQQNAILLDIVIAILKLKKLDDTDEYIDINPNVKCLPATVDGLTDRFNQLFTQHGKHEHRNELVFLLDEVLRQDGINRDEYAQLNNMLAESLDEEDDDDEEERESTKDDLTTMEDETREGKLKKLIRLTVECLTQHDKKELLELIKEFRKDVGEDFLDTVLELEELVDVYLLDEFIDSESVLTKIDKLRRMLDNSAAIPKSNQHRLHILLDDINQNRYRVQTILKRLADADDVEHLSFTLK